MQPYSLQMGRTQHCRWESRPAIVGIGSVEGPSVENEGKFEMKLRTQIGLVALVPISSLLYAFFALSAARGGEGCSDIACMEDLMEITIALRMYAMDHQDHFPERLDALCPAYLEDGSLLEDLAYRPGLTERDWDKIIAWDDHYWYHVCTDETQVRALQVSGAFSIYNIGEKENYQGNLRKTLFWRFWGVPIEEKRPTLAEVQQAQAVREEQPFTEPAPGKEIAAQSKRRRG